MTETHTFYESFLQFISKYDSKNPCSLLKKPSFSITLPVVDTCILTCQWYHLADAEMVLGCVVSLLVSMP